MHAGKIAAPYIKTGVRRILAVCKDGPMNTHVQRSACLARLSGVAIQRVILKLPRICFTTIQA